MTHAEKYADWRARHESKDAALRSALARELGMRGGVKTDLGERTITRFATTVLSALLTWGEEPLPEVELPPFEAAKKTLDLEEVPLVGRDRAAGERDD